jgi:non-ribosomal peptide synthase protein (TIGR01720 family)
MTTGASAEDWSGFEIAIVGMAGRFPGARDVDQFWRNLRDGVESIAVLSDEELTAAGVDAASLSNPDYVKAAARLDDIDLFDAGFFGITPREAEIMDPQHRLFLETAWESLESAGFDPARCPGAVGVFGGTSTNSYFLNNLQAASGIDAGALPTLFGNQADYLTTRVSYKLGLKGPSLDVQTGCSSSLVAVHLACQALIAGECDLALAGGVGVMVPHGRGYVHQEQGIYSPDGHCRAFSSRAEGTVGGSGVAVVTLRRLADALEDGDPIVAVIKGTAVNNDGSEKVGYAAPSIDGQAQVIRNALAMADVDASSIGYVETHGTGTSLGDPIEIAALSMAFDDASIARGACAVGSLKTNIGHLDAAAGVAGLIKAALALQHQQLPASLNCEEPDPKIDFPSTPFRVNTQLTPWSSAGPRRAGVSSFGIGGTNAHVILQEAPQRRSETSEASGHSLLVLSARSGTALDQACVRLGEQLAMDADSALADVAWTLATGRHDFAHRRAVVVTDASDAAVALGATEQAGGDRRRATNLVQELAERKAVFLFPGQGAQYVDMGRELYDRLPVFREHVDRAAELLRPELGLDLRELLYPSAENVESSAEQLRQTALTQPALFVIEHALAQQFMAWGVRPTAMIGHSIGEYVAAVLAGVFNLEDGLSLVAARGRLMQELPAGDMLALSLPAEEVEPLLGADVSLAAVNDHGACVVSGTAQAIATFAEQMKARKVAMQILHTSHAFHSAMMEPILQAFAERVTVAAPSAPSIPFVSTLTGTWITDEQATDPGYWARHLRETVRFARGVDTLLADDRHVLLEVGPGNTLTSLSTRIARRRDKDETQSAPAHPRLVVASMRHPREKSSDEANLLTALGQLWAARVPIDWDSVLQGEDRRRVRLPTYPFQRQRFWIEPDGEFRPQQQTGKLPDIADWFSVPSWTRSTQALDGSPTWQPQHVLVLGGDEVGGATSGQVADAVVNTLRERGVSVTRVTAGGEARPAAESGAHVLDPNRREDYDTLVDELSQGAAWPDAVLHLWALDSEAGDGARSLDRGFFSVLFLAQALAAKRESQAPGERPTGAGSPMLVATRQLASVTGDEALLPEQATVLGAAQAIGQECPGLSCRTIDVGAEGTAGCNDAAALATRLLAELAVPDGEPLVAWRGAHRWVAGHSRVVVSARQTQPDAVPAPLREQGHYMVLGGLGSIGLEVATSLARAPGARLTLVSRSEFPAPDEWNAWLQSHPADDDTSRRMARMTELIEGGAQIWCARADASDSAAMTEVLAEAERRFGILHGVVHAAGADKTMAPLSLAVRDDCLAQLHPKRSGLAVLEQLLAGRTLDFCVIQSSLSSWLGALGMVGYVAAHHFVDAFVAAHNATSQQPWTCANWDNWLSWKEREFVHDRGGEAYYMTPEEGAEAFARVLAMPPGTQVVVSTGDLSARIAQWIAGGHDAPADESATGQNLHARPDLTSEYEAPTTPAEKALANAWSEVLGIGEIGVHDNFFELGGDSVLGLQIVARVGQAGFHITPGQIFEQPTILGLAGVAEAQGAAATPKAEQGLLTGSAPLLPIQHWFFEQDIPDRQHFNLPMLFDVPATTDAAQLADAIDHLVAHHDALRLRFVDDGTGMLQSHATDVGSVTVSVFDLADTPEADRPAVMTRHADALHQGFDLGTGPLMAAGLFRHGGDRPAQVLWVVHHLLLDVVSWRTLMGDLTTALEQRAKGSTMVLPKKTTAFKVWAEALAEHAGSASLGLESSHWESLGRLELAPLPRDVETGENIFSSSRSVTVSLDEERTRALLHDVPPVYETRIDEVLLTALLLSMSRWTGHDTVLVDLEGHGRQDVVPGCDLSRTVGWFTTLYPAALSLDSGRDPGAALKSVKEQLRAIPHQGIGYGLLRYVNDDEALRASMAALPRPELNFLYLGQFDGALSGSGVQLLDQVSGRPCSEAAPRAYLLELVALVIGGRLKLELSFSEHRHSLQTAETLAQGFLDELSALIAHCKDPAAGGRTPSDFPGAKVSQKSLDMLLAKIGKGKGRKGGGR